MIFKIEDKVFDYAYGWGQVIKLKLNTTFTYPIVVMFTDDNRIAYTVKGKLELDGKPSLSFTEYTLEGFSQLRPKEEKPFDRWYVWDEYTKCIIFEGVNVRYGLNVTGGWFCSKRLNCSRTIRPAMRLATDAEILEKLSAYATSIGIKAGATFTGIGKDYSTKIEDKPLVGFAYQKKSNCLYFNHWLIMRDGKWVTVVEQPKTLEEEIQAIKKHLGI
jgi:hypothetical protein